jgi:hypothetical protein
MFSGECLFLAGFNGSLCRRKMGNSLKTLLFTALQKLPNTGEYPRPPRLVKKAAQILVRLGLTPSPHKEFSMLSEAQMAAKRNRMIKNLTEHIETRHACLRNLKQNRREVVGVVTTSEKFYDKTEGEDGIAITFQFTTHTGQIVTAECRTTIHFPSAAQWKAYADERRVGAPIKVLYDQNDPQKHLVNFGEAKFALDEEIESGERQLQQAQKQFA